MATTLGMVVAQDLINTTLNVLERGDAVFQTDFEHPFLKALKAKQKTFASGQQVISLPVQGTKMSSITGVLQGYSNDDQLNFSQSQFTQRATYPWKEVHMGLIITFTELKIDGITVTQGKTFSQHSDSELNQLIAIARNRKQDFDSSWMEVNENMLFLDGTQDSKQVPGLQSILTDSPATGTTGGISRSANTWWQHFAAVGTNKIVASESGQNLSRYLIDLVPQMKRFGGRPDKWLAGSGFMSKLNQEIRAKGLLTQSGFSKDNNIGMGMAMLPGVGALEYCPLFDNNGWSNRCAILDSRRFTLMPEQGEADRTLMPERPYNYMVWMMSKTWTGGLVCNQLNAQAIIEAA